MALQADLLRIAATLPRGDETRRKLLAVLREGVSFNDVILHVKDDVELLYNPFIGRVEVGMGGEWWGGTVKGPGRYVFPHRKESVDPAYKPVTVVVNKTGSTMQFHVMGGFGQGATFKLSLT
jgi:hypothetical protein